jgi:hypothetical protein
MAKRTFGHALLLIITRVLPLSYACESILIFNAGGVQYFIDKYNHISKNYEL